MTANRDQQQERGEAVRHNDPHVLINWRCVSVIENWGGCVYYSELKLRYPSQSENRTSPWDCIRTDPGWKQAWAAEQKSREIDGGSPVMPGSQARPWPAIQQP
ncbi:hypothetical protein EMCRGX_G013743 [Ephydatia muelleri]